HRVAGEHESAGGEHAGGEQVPAPLIHFVGDATPYQHADAATDIRYHGEPADLHIGEIAERFDDLWYEIQHAEARRDDAEVIHGQQQHLGMLYFIPQI